MKPNIYINPQGGYIALISAIVISILLILITITLSFTGFYSRFNVLDSEYKKVSNGLAEACANAAILKLANDPSYANATAEDIILDVATNKKCKIVSVSPTGAVTPKVIQAQAVYNKTFTDLKVIVTPTASDIVINSWEECAVSPCP